MSIKTFYTDLFEILQWKLVHWIHKSHVSNHKIKNWTSDCHWSVFFTGSRNFNFSLFSIDQLLIDDIWCGLENKDFNVVYRETYYLICLSMYKIKIHNSSFILYILQAQSESIGVFQEQNSLSLLWNAIMNLTSLAVEINFSIMALSWEPLLKN